MTEHTDGPKREDFDTAAEYIAAFETFHDERKPTTLDVLDRSSRLASESIRAIALQLRRVSSPEPEDAEWPFRVWTDFQFLIAALWRLRSAAQAAASADELVNRELDEFDRALPDLARMRHVAQHLDDYAIDHPTKRRQKKPDSDDLVGRRMLEVGSWNQARFEWLGGTLELQNARTASQRLYTAIRAARDRH